MIFALARAVEAKDAYTEGHLQRLALYAVAIGERLGLSGDELIALRYGALLHDVGKVGVDEMIIRKGGPLTPAEYRVMQQHTLIGERIVQPLRMAHRGRADRALPPRALGWPRLPRWAGARIHPALRADRGRGRCL